MKNRYSDRNKIILFLLALLFVSGILLICGFFFNNSKATALSRYETNVFYPIVSDANDTILLDAAGNYIENEDQKNATLAIVGSMGISRLASENYKENSEYSLLNGYFWRNFGVTESYRLTLDSELSSKCYNALESFGDEFEIGIVLVADKISGELLVCTEYPVTHNEDKPDPDGLYVFDALKSTFIPGSSFKPVSLACFFETGGKNLEFNCDGDIAIVDSKNGTSTTITCPKAHGKQELKELLVNSCNCGFAYMGCKIGLKEMKKTIDKFGLTDGVSLMNSLDLKSVGSSFAIEDKPQLAASSFGQGNNLINSLGILRFIRAVSNNGITGLTVEKDAHHQEEEIMSKKTAAEVSEMMYAAGKSYGFQDVAAKTGTAEIGNGLNNSWFVGFTTDYSFVIVFHKTEHSGISGAGEIFRMIKPSLDSYWHN